MGLAHFDDVSGYEVGLGHLRGRWTLLGDAAGSETVGVRRIELPAGGWSTPAHEHGRAEEIFYVLDGAGVSWQRGATAAIGRGDCIVYHPRRGAHTLYADEPLDVLAFGLREYDEALRLPRLGMSLVGNRAVASEPGSADGHPVQFLREAELGPPELAPDRGPRPATIVNLDAVEPVTVDRGRVKRTRRRISAQAGSRSVGLQHVEVAPGRESGPQHCHSLEDEIFVMLDGEGMLVLGDDQTPVRAGHVIARPAGTGVAHMFVAGSAGPLRYLAFGTRDHGDVCYYPRSDKIAWRGVGVIARLTALDYWDGED